ncbi:50S ribosomal protein L29 [Candidatus Pacearchaeota archaeon]|nr:50S ribosomal protein L29 [Candidatus Pacearchaeota archaeon]
MVQTKYKDLKNLGKEDIEKKIKELKLELVKSRVSSAKSGSSKIKKTKRMIAKILTFNKSVKEKLNNK